MSEFPNFIKSQLCCYGNDPCLLVL